MPTPETMNTLENTINNFVLSFGAPILVILVILIVVMGAVYLVVRATQSE